MGTLSSGDGQESRFEDEIRVALQVLPSLRHLSLRVTPDSPYVRFESIIQLGGANEGTQRAGVFISHIGQERPVALVLQKFIRQAFNSAFSRFCFL
jgi:hypothetical protein